MKKRVELFRDRFPIEQINPHDPHQYDQWQLFEYLKDPSFNEYDTSRWARYKFCLVHRYGLFYERPKRITDIAHLFGYKTSERIARYINSGLNRFRKKLKTQKFPFTDENFSIKIHHMGMLYDIDIDLFVSYYNHIKKQ